MSTKTKKSRSTSSSSRHDWRERRKLYASRAWKALAWVAKQKAGWRCSRCSKPGKLEAHHVDKSAERFFDPENVICICVDCHRAEHAPKSDYWKRRRAAFRFAEELRS